MPVTVNLSSMNDGVENSRILQRAVDCGGDILVSAPGVYRLAETIYR